MSGQHFTFPPPPPAPPQDSQTYPAYSQASRGHNAYGGRGNRRDTGYQGYGRGNQGSGGVRGRNYGSAPAYGVHPAVVNRQTGPHNGGASAQDGYHRNGGYPLPNYPAVQIPQYAAYIGHDLERQSSDPGVHTGLRPPQVGCPPSPQNSHLYYNGHRSYPSNGHSLPIQPMAREIQNPSNARYNIHGSINKPAPMGPPIRMGFDDDKRDHQPSSRTQPTSSSAISFQTGMSNDGGSLYPYDPTMAVQLARHDSPQSFPGHRGSGQKRGHREAFGRQRNQNSRPQAAPAVPSFGGALPLPVKPPSIQDHARKPRKKKRKHNQLGLTPKKEEHESSEEEEDDADEESRLAAVSTDSSVGSRLLRFEYNGHTSTLQSSSDIASWIEERRKRYPTKARAAEASECKRQRDEVHKAANQARKEVQEKQRAENKRNHEQTLEAEQKEKYPRQKSEDVAAKAKRKVEKLRKQLEKEEKRAAKAEARVAKQKQRGFGDGGDERAAPSEDGLKKRKRIDSNEYETKRLAEVRRAETVQPGLAISAINTEAIAVASLNNPNSFSKISKVDSTINDPQEKVQASSNPVPDPLTPMSQPPAPDDALEPQQPLSGISNAPDIVSEHHKETVAQNIDSVSKSESSSELSSTDSEEFTSSSGSSTSDPESDSGAPDESTSRRNGPERVPAMKQRRPRNICKDFLKSGRCKRGDNCQYRHELPERRSRHTGRKEDKKAQGKTERIGLHQRVSLFIAAGSL